MGDSITVGKLYSLLIRLMELEKIPSHRLTDEELYEIKDIQIKLQSYDED